MNRFYHVRTVLYRFFYFITICKFAILYVLNGTNQSEFYDFIYKKAVITCENFDKFSLRYLAEYGFIYPRVAASIFKLSILLLHTQ